jgi:hypothetical protein
MKKIAELEEMLRNEINKNTKPYLENCKWVVSKPTEKTKMLRLAITYLKECNPTEDAILKQLDIANKSLDVLNRRRGDWIEAHKKDLAINRVLNKTSYYDKLHDVPQIKKQIKLLELILLS